MEGITVIIPVFNEEKNLVKLLPQLHSIISSCCSSYELLVVDSKKSLDNTKAVCEKHNAIYVKQAGSGYADAFKTGINVAGFDAIIVVDGDCSQDVFKIPLMYNAYKNGSDVVIGSRYTYGGKSNDPIISRMMSKTLNLVYRLVFGLEQRDISTDFRIYHKNQLQRIKMKCVNFDVIEETLILLKRNNPDLIVTEIPIDYRPREQGYSKRRLFLFVWDYIKLIFRLVKDHSI